MILKFRVWDGDEEVMIYSSEYPLLCVFFEIANRHYEDKHIQQFTGFDDDSGKEIYDGDLIMIDNAYGPYRVFWDNKRGAWCSCAYDDSDLIASYSHMKVVGHIFDGTKYEGEQ